MDTKRSMSMTWKGLGWLRTMIALGLIFALGASPLSVQSSGRSPADPTAGSWLALSTGTDGSVYAIAVSGSDVYVGGMFTRAGTCTIGCNNIAKWNTTTHTWSALDSGTNGAVHAVAVSGNRVLVGGTFDHADIVAANRIAEWDGADWKPLGTGTNNIVHAIAINGSDVYAGGEFTEAGGCAGVNQCYFIAKWDGAAWSRLGTGMDSYVYAIAIQGSDVYVGGQFSTAGGVSAANITKWDGSNWSAMGAGTDGVVRAIGVSGSDVYAGGFFTTAGSVSVTNIAKWSASGWSALGAGTGDNGEILAVSAIGSDVYVGGYFHDRDNGAPNYIAKWNGSGWSPLGTGTDGAVRGIAATASGNIYVGGYFNSAGGVANTPHIADYFDPSSNADLSDLVLSSGTLEPPFASGTTAYTAEVVKSIAQITITPTASNLYAEIEVNGVVVASGNPSGTINLDFGDNLINIVVTAQDGTTTKTYAVIVRRDAFNIYLPILNRE